MSYSLIAAFYGVTLKSRIKNSFIFLTRNTLSNDIVRAATNYSFLGFKIIVLGCKRNYNGIQSAHSDVINSRESRNVCTRAERNRLANQQVLKVIHEIVPAEKDSNIYHTQNCI